MRRTDYSFRAGHDEFSGGNELIFPRPAANGFNSIRTFCRLPQCEKSFFQALTDCAVRLAKNEHLVLIEKIFAKPMKQMQEVSQESNAIENRDFDAACFIILGAAIFTNVVGHRLGRNEDVILNGFSLGGDFLERAINVAALNSLVLHLIARHHFVIAEQRDLNIAHCAGLFVRSVVSDVQITLLGDDKVVTSYEMKNKAVQRSDIDRCAPENRRPRKIRSKLHLHFDRACDRRRS